MTTVVREVAGHSGLWGSATDNLCDLTCGDQLPALRQVVVVAHRFTRVAVAFEQLLDVGEVVEGELQLLHRLGDQLLGLWQVVGVVEFLVAEPLEGVELVVVLLDLVDGEAAPAALG